MSALTRYPGGRDLPLDACLVHARLEGGRLEAKALSRVPFAPYTPAHLVEHRDDVPALDRLQRLPRRPFRVQGAREIHVQGGTGAQDRRALDDVPQLPHVPGPRVALQRLHASLRDLLDRLALRLPELAHEGPHQEWDVIRARSQRRHRDGKDVQPAAES